MIDRLIRSRRRTFTLQITTDAQLVVRAPRWATDAAIHELVNDKIDWIRKKQAAVRVALSERTEHLREQQNSYLYLGERHSRTPELNPTEAWYRKQAREILSERVALFAQRSGQTPHSVRITGARTRWGSCSTKGSLNFTWRLIMAPLWVVDYVVAHEIAHMSHHNHSRRFWAAVAELFPESKAARQWLRANQARLTM